MSTYVIYPTEEQTKAVEAFLTALEVSFVKDEEEPLPDHVLKGIAQSEKDFEEGRYISLDDFKKRLSAK